MKIAFIDDPKCCYGCPFEDRHYCRYSERHIEDCDVNKEVAEWCELRDMPERNDSAEKWYGRYEYGLRDGRNALLEELWEGK